MEINTSRQLSLLIDHNNIEAILSEAETVFLSYYSSGAFSRVKTAFYHIYSLYNGFYPGYRKCNTEYHDLKHTYDVFIATFRLIDGRNLYGKVFTEEIASDLMIAALMHDTGYIQTETDTEGTGAKYTKTHIKRSMDFTKQNAATFHLTGRNVSQINRYISCTGLNADCMENFTVNDLEAGAVLGTADLLGQMADRAYLEKLLFLYYEFVEGGMEGFTCSFDILRQTLAFYEATLERMDRTLIKSYNYARYHFFERYGIDENLYITAIGKQMEYLKSIVNDNYSNFRNKLKRLDIEEAEKKYLS